MNEYCYLCGVELSEKNKHKEHIIQNAIGGTLKPDNILCATCGDDLGKEIDVPFVKIFDGISTRLDIKKDRKTKNKKLSGNLNGIEITWENFKITPKKPEYIYDENTKKLVIIASKKAATNFKNKVIKEIGESNISSIKIIDDMKGMGPIKFPFMLDNYAFKRGLAKISAGFATLKGIKREQLNLLIDLKNKKIHDQISVIPFYPSGPIERFIELTRIHLDYEYPYHSITLFTLPYHPSENMGDKKMLICFIELFSTFQQYVILSLNYKGNNLYETYGQKIFKKDDIELDSFLDPKTIDIHLKSLGLTYDAITQYKTDEDLHKFFEKKYNQLKYSFNFDNHINTLLSNLLLSMNYIKIDMTQHLPPESIEIVTKAKDYFYENIERLICLKKNMELYYHVDENDNEYFSPKAFRVYFYDENINVKNYFNSSLEATDAELIKQYAHMKFFTLSYYIEKKTFNDIGHNNAN